MTLIKYRPTLSHYPYSTTISTRWNDSDIYGHLNNVIYYQLYDTAVNAYMIHHCGFDPQESPQIGLVVSSGTDYHEVVQGFPHPIIIGMSVIKLGNSSVEYELAVFQPDSPDDKNPRAKAVGKFIHVFVERETNKTSTSGMSSNIRRGLEAIYKEKQKL